MNPNPLKDTLIAPDMFSIIVEFTCRAGEKPSKLLKFLSDYETSTPKWDGASLAGISVTQSPSGQVTASPTDVLAHVVLEGGFRGLEFIPHVSAKGMNSAEIEVYLAGLMSHGVKNCLVVTGDKPLVGKSVFEMDSLNVLQLIRRLNSDARLAAGTKPDVPSLFAGAGAGLTKYEEGTCIQQMIKVEKKVRAGKAGFIITNIVYDARKVEDFFRFLDEYDVLVPVIGNVFLLNKAAARRMEDEKLPGVFISPELCKKVASESQDDFILRAAQQVAMWKDLGAAGVDIGNVENLELVDKIVQKGLEIGSDWRDARDNITFPLNAPDAFYLYQNKIPTIRRTPKVPFRRKVLNQIHPRLFEPQAAGCRMMRFICEHSTSIQRKDGIMYTVFELFEKAAKGVMAKCKSCGDCYLPENFFVCLMGECTKGLTNVPCGDATADGHCGIETEKLCAGQLVYDAAMYFTKGDMNALRTLINPPKNPDLDRTSSFRNFYLKEDHNMQNQLSVVGERIHTTIPKVKKVYEEIKADGAEFRDDSAQVDYIRKMVEAQVLRGADYIDCNIDDAGEAKEELATKLMRNTIRIIVEEGQGVPPCVDSSDMRTLKAGVDEYYRVAGPDAAPPLVNSANAGNLNELWELSKIGKIRAIYMLMESSLAGGAEGREYVTPEEMFDGAIEFYREARKRGFAKEDIFFDPTTLPLAIEFSRFEQPGFNYCAFEALRLIMENEEMKGVNAILGISNLVRDFPSGRKIGLLRAYVNLAMDRGLTAVIAEVEREFGLKPPEDEEIVDIVRAFIEYDGSPEAYQRMQDAYNLYRTYS